MTVRDDQITINELREELRKLTATYDELRRDYQELVALDETGMRVRISELEHRCVGQESYIQSLRETLAEEIETVSKMHAELSILRGHSDARVAAEQNAELKLTVRNLTQEVREVQKILDERVGMPISLILQDYRATIRCLTSERNELQGKLDRGHS